MDAMHIDTPSYALEVGTSSVSITFDDTGKTHTSLVIFNEGATPVFMLTGETSAPTAVYPTTGTKLTGKVIAGGATVTFQKGAKDGFLSAIRGSGTGLIHVAVGTGE